VLSGDGLIDRVLATVNGEVVTESDVRWELALDPDVQPLDLSVENRRTMLERIIDQRILFQEATKVPQIPPTDAEIQSYIRTSLLERFGSQDAFRARIRKVGLDFATLREIVTKRLSLLKYIEFRFRSFVIIPPEEIERYYNEVAVPRMKNRGTEMRSLEEMRTQIENTLAGEKINSELDQFLDEARARAQIVRLAEIK
jgi:SurA N-terminal domain.